MISNIEPAEHPLKQPSIVLAEQLFREAIKAGRYRSGASIKESVVAREFDLPRTAVREMLNQAVHWGVVEYSPYRGFRIRDFELRDAWEWCTLREGIEPVAARLLAQNCPDFVYDILAGSYEKMAACSDPVSKEAWNYDIEFHSTVVRYCGNSSIEDLYTKIYLSSDFYYDAIQRYSAKIAAIEHDVNWHAFEVSTPEEAKSKDVASTLFWHQKMLEAIRAGQEKFAEYLFREHLHDIRIKHEILYKKSAKLDLCR